MFLTRISINMIQIAFNLRIPKMLFMIRSSPAYLCFPRIFH